MEPRGVARHAELTRLLLQYGADLLPQIRAAMK